MAKWVRQPQEKEGQDYWFAGTCYITNGVDGEIPEAERMQILQDLWAFVREKQGIDYLQVYVNEATGRKVWVIDQVTRAETKDGSHPPEHNHFTILFPEEY
jgi:hypothetical protein